MKHRTTAAMMLAVAVAAMVCHFASVGINLRRRGFTSGEALGAIGTTLTVAIIPSCAAIAMLRMGDRWKSRTTSLRLQKPNNERGTEASHPAPSVGSVPRE
jgi:hypothetical protein